MWFGISEEIGMNSEENGELHLATPSLNNGR
jgi:hypothetical protein